MYFPAYYNEHISAVIEAYQQARAQVKNGTGFVFLTDVHIARNTRYSVPLIHYIKEHTDIQNVLCGGDFVWAFGSANLCREQLTLSLEYLDALREDMNVYIARGNHDATIRKSREEDVGYTMPYGQVRSAFAAHNSPATCAPEGKLYFYVDDTDAKIRYVILDTSEKHLAEDQPWGVQYGMLDEQLRWLCDTALRLEDGRDWSVIVLGHIPCYEKITDAGSVLAPLRDILEAFRNKQCCQYGDFRNSKAELVMYLAGHMHQDLDAVSNGVLHIATGCDAYCVDDGMPRDVGTTNTVLFDVFLVDKDKKTVQTFRVGAGESRKFDY